MYATSDFAASASTHRCAYLHSCCQGVCASSACGFATSAAVERVRSPAFRNPPAAHSGVAGVEGLAPPVQSTHQTLFVDGDQCAHSPTSSTFAHEWQRPPYFSEMKRRSSGRIVNGSRGERSETLDRRIERVGEPARISATRHLASHSRRLTRCRFSPWVHSRQNKSPDTSTARTNDATSGMRHIIQKLNAPGAGPRVCGIPFDVTSRFVVAPLRPPRETVQVRAVSPERDAWEIRFPRMQGHRVELCEEQLSATFDENSTLELEPDPVGPSITRNDGIVGEGVELGLEHLEKMPPSAVVDDSKAGGRPSSAAWPRPTRGCVPMSGTMGLGWRFLPFSG